jgi:hypothetical protein
MTVMLVVAAKAGTHLAWCRFNMDSPFLGNDEPGVLHANEFAPG